MVGCCCCGGELLWTVVAAEECCGCCVVLECDHAEVVTRFGSEGTEGVGNGNPTTWQLLGPLFALGGPRGGGVASATRLDGTF